MEQTFIMIKPDGVQRGLVGDIISRFEKKGFTLKGLKLLTVERSFAESHYADLSSKPFFNGLVEYIVSGPVVAMVWEGKKLLLPVGLSLVQQTHWLLPPALFVVTLLLTLAGTSSMEAIQSKVLERRLLCGSLKELLNGRAAFTLGSMNKV